MSDFKHLRFGKDSRQSLLAGATILANAVKVTLGPGGMNVVIEQENGPPLVTKDGVTVARSINLRDKYENLGAQIIKDAASRACEVAGDGTTTATVLTHSIFQNLIANDVKSFADLKAGAMEALGEIFFLLDQNKKKISSRDEIIAVGTISANGETHIGNLLAQAFEAVGNDGIITVEDAKGFFTHLETTNGTEIDRGFISPYFVTDSEKMMAVLEKPYIIITNKKISTAKEVIPALEKAHAARRPLLIIADDVDGEALQTIFMNKTKGIMQVCVIRAPEFGEGRVQALEDLAALTGARFEPDRQFETIQGVDFGTCEKVVISRSKSIFVNPKSNQERMEARIEAIAEALENPAITQGERELLYRRRKRLAGSVAVIRVGGATEAEMQERRDRVDDALHAVKAALDGGILPGGGNALLFASKSISIHATGFTSDFVTGFNAVMNACAIPFKTIMSNAGIASDEIEKIDSRFKFGSGYDVSSMTWCDDLISNGIIDPYLVIRSSIEHSVSAALMLASVGASIVADDSKNLEQQNVS